MLTSYMEHQICIMCNGFVDFAIEKFRSIHVFSKIGVLRSDHLLLDSSVSFSKIGLSVVVSSHTQIRIRFSYVVPCVIIIMQERLKRMNERLLPWILSILPGVQHAHQDKAPYRLSRIVHTVILPG